MSLHEQVALQIIAHPFVRWEKVVPPMGGALITTGVHAETFELALEDLGVEWDDDLALAVKLYVPEMLKMFAERAKAAMPKVEPPAGV
jgi:hypothetical protein